ncbi:unnamed protein product [Diplocarpon coronariae]
MPESVFSRRVGEQRNSQIRQILGQPAIEPVLRNSTSRLAFSLPRADWRSGYREAVTLTWTLRELVAAYACGAIGLWGYRTDYTTIRLHDYRTTRPQARATAWLLTATSVFLVFFVVSMQQQTQVNLSYHVTSSFALLPRTATSGMAYVRDVFMADTSSLKNRALVFAFSTTPYIATPFIATPFIGLVLIIAAFVPILLPISLSSYQSPGNATLNAELYGSLSSPSEPLAAKF